ncbi:MAG: Hpt domain-containing protein [Defluviitaleaceae bacterium]|nr:Hpt domain-containing protein [Defluviitaleaceae bacterium]
MLSREEMKTRYDFVRSQKYTFQDLQAEIAANHFSTAHRLVHTLKSNAAQINEQELVNVAFVVEQDLRNKKTPNAHDMAALEAELNRVFVKINESGIVELYSQNMPPTRSEQAVLFDRLQTLLEANDAACVELLPEIAVIYETKVLVRQIEMYALADALNTLKILRDVLGI